MTRTKYIGPADKIYLLANLAEEMGFTPKFIDNFDGTPKALIPDLSDKTYSIFRTKEGAVSKGDVTLKEMIGLLMSTPLLTTEDGISKYEGDSWYYVVVGTDKIQETNTLEYRGSTYKPVLHFSTQEAARNYLTVVEASNILKDFPTYSKYLVK